MSDSLLPENYGALLGEIKERIHRAQYAALRAVNKELVALYWDIGQMIVGRQKGRSWGKTVVERLAGDLQAAFPGVGGFSASNLWRMKAFYEAYASSGKLAPLVREISWSPVRRPQTHRRRDLPHRQTPAEGAQRHASRTGRDRQAAGGDRMRAIEGFSGVRAELAELNKGAVELAARIQGNFAELGI